MNMLMPVVSIARLMPFHEATMLYFWRAVSGNRGSGAAGAGGSFALRLLSAPFLLSLPLLAANLPNSQPILLLLLNLCLSPESRLYFFMISPICLTTNTMRQLTQSLLSPVHKQTTPTGRPFIVITLNRNKFNPSFSAHL